MTSTIAFITCIISIIIFIGATLAISVNNRHGLIGLGFCIYWIFFFLIPAAFHLRSGVYPFYSMTYEDSLQESAVFGVLVFSLFSLLGYFSEKSRSTTSEQVRWQVSREGLSVIITLAALFQIAMIFKFGLNSFTVTRKEFTLEELGGGPLVLVLMGLVRSVSFLSLILFFLLGRKTYSRLVFVSGLSLLTALFLVVNYPLALPRYIFFSYILATIYIFTPSGRKTKLAVLAAFAIGVTTVFPVASQISRGEDGYAGLDLFKYYSSHGDFDGLQSTINVFSYVDEKGVTWGRQLLGTVLFFIPRSFWPDKPVPTGMMAADHQGYDFSNISSPIISEIYIDFGWPGLAFVSFLLGFFIRATDRASLNCKKNENWTGIITCAIFFSFLMILMRGSLMAVIGNVLACLGVAFLFSRLALKRR